jgi:hypothetical protein
MVLVFGNDMYDKQLWNVKSQWKSLVSMPDMINKYQLHKLLQKTDIVAPTVLIDKSGPPPNLARISKSYSDNIWIWRTDNKIGGGLDVVVITNQKELEHIFSNFQKKIINPALGGGNAILSKYITNPSLWINPHNKEGYKYHLRIYLLVVAGKKNGINASVFKYGEIVLAEKPYHPGDWLNYEIHDTHLSYAHFPADYVNQKYTSNHILQQICKMLANVIGETKKSLEIHPEAAINFQVFGCDFMIDDTGKAYLIEINNMPCFEKQPPELYKGLSTKQETRLTLHKIALTNILSYVVDYKTKKYSASIEDQLANKSITMVEVFNTIS